MKRNYAALNWFRSIDKITFFLVLVLIVIGSVLITSSSPVIAKKIGIASSYHFIYNQALNVLLSLFLMVFFSCLSQTQVKKLSSILLVILVLLIIITLFKSSNIKGSKRWISIFGFSLQPSEPIKPFFAIVSAWLISSNIKNCKYVMAIYLTISSLLLLQPDFGMFIIVSVIFFSQLFVSRINIIFFPALLLIFLVIIFGAYTTIPHVKHRIDNFFDKKVGDNFQVQKAMESFSRGGLYGVGPAEGKVKLHLPDAHTDFIFSVAGEEFGFVLTFSVVFIYFYLITHNILKSCTIQDGFTLIAITGIVTYIAAQALINISVNLHLLPTKGMTLPFISYGGSSMLSSGISIGILLAFSRKKYSIDFNKYRMQ